MDAMTKTSKALSEAARLMGRKGGQHAGALRMTNLTREERVRIAKLAIETRWKKHRDEKAKQAEAAQRAGTHGKDRAGNGPRPVQKIERAPGPVASKNPRKTQRPQGDAQ